MNPDVKTRWVAALRSGNYRQARNYLRTAEGYCCLGVLCDIVDPDGWEDTLLPLMGAGVARQPHRGHLGAPNERISAHAELDEHLIKELVNMNDGGHTFASIADWIEQR